jgi:Ni2+-binding GTPase involved in maturation of urease and hydrogenase
MIVGQRKTKSARVSLDNTAGSRKTRLCESLIASQEDDVKIIAVKGEASQQIKGTTFDKVLRVNDVKQLDMNREEK